MACHFIVAGSADIKSVNHATKTLEYGSDNCDNKATITVKGVTKEIKRRK